MAQRSERTIYLDHAATTAVDPRVVEAMLPFWTEQYGNASSIYALGREANHAMDEARHTVAGILNCSPQEVIFTACGTESEGVESSNPISTCVLRVMASNSLDVGRS